MFRVNQIAAFFLLTITVPAGVYAGTVGRVVPIRGSVADVVYDDRRGVVYAANFTADRIEVISVAENKVLTPIMTSERPSAMALSPDQRFLVVGHHTGGLTIHDFDANQVRDLTMSSPVLAVAFGANHDAFIVASNGFYLLTPLTGLMRKIDETLSGTGSVPVPPGTLPREIIKASAGVSGNGMVIHVLAEAAGGEQGSPAEGGSDCVKPVPGEVNYLIRYDVESGSLNVEGVTAAPPLGPHLMSVDETGGNIMAGWARLSLSPRFIVMAQLPNTSGEYAAGTTAWDFHRNVIYAQASLIGKTLNAATTQPPVLHVLDTDNLSIREKVLLPQWLSGKTVFSKAMDLMVSAANSGVYILPLSELYEAPRIAASTEDLMFAGDACRRNPISKTFEVADPTGKQVDFKISMAGSVKGVRVYPLEGRTPMTVTVEVDPRAFQYQKGTVSVQLQLASKAAVNIPRPVRLLVNTKEFQQRGTLVNVPGTLTDILTDMYRDRVYVLRQDRNQVLVYEAENFELKATLRTGNTPVQMAMTPDASRLLVTNDNSQLVNVYNLETLEAEAPVELPLGVYGRSIAASSDAIWITGRVVGNSDDAGIALKVDLGLRLATAPPRLGINCNRVDIRSTLTAAPYGGTILLAQPNGNVHLYESFSDKWVAGRDDFDALSGTAAVLNDSMFLVGNTVLDTALVPLHRLDEQAGASAGAVGLDSSFIRITSSTSGSGFAERVDIGAFPASRSVSLAESPVTLSDPATEPTDFTGVALLSFARSLVQDRVTQRFYMLSTSGLTVLDPSFDDPVPTPQVDGIVSAADGGAKVAPGSLIRITGRGFASTGESAGSTPWPTALANACVALSGSALPLSSVSPGEIVAQLPYTTVGTLPLTVKSAGGASVPFALTVLPAAPAIFKTQAAPGIEISTVIRVKNGQVVTVANPIRPEDQLSIYLAGMGRVSGDVEPGTAAPADPPASVLLSPRVFLGSTELDVRFAGLVPGEVGVYRIDVSVPWKLNQSGMQVPLSVVQAGASAEVIVRVLD